MAIKTGLTTISTETIYDILHNYANGMNQKQFASELVAKRAMDAVDAKRSVKQFFQLFESEVSRQIIKRIHTSLPARVFRQVLLTEVGKSNKLFGDFLKQVFWKAFRSKTNIAFFSVQDVILKHYPTADATEQMQVFNELVKMARQFGILTNENNPYIQRGVDRCTILYTLYYLRGRSLDHPDYALIGLSTPAFVMDALLTWKAWKWWSVDADDNITFNISSEKELVEAIRKEHDI